jgi:hypothetical protein
MWIVRWGFATVFSVLAVFATFASLFGTHDLSWNWNGVLWLCAINLLIVGPLWAAAAFSGPRSLKNSIIAGTIAYVVVGGGLSFFDVSLYHARLASSGTCTNRLKYIGLALHQYQNAYGSLPPAYLADAKGKPMHSWRVLLLPFMGGEEIYRKYSFNEPWDGPNNRKLSRDFATFFRCTKASDKDDDTSYVAIVGRETAWPGRNSVRLKDVRDGLHETILVVEVANSGIKWMEPRDLSFDQLDFHVNGPKGKSVSSLHAERANVLMADACVKCLGNDLSPSTLRALLTINGGEKLPPDFFD